MQNNNFEHLLKMELVISKKKISKNQKKNLIKVLFKFTGDRKKF